MPFFKSFSEDNKLAKRKKEHDKLNAKLSRLKKEEDNRALRKIIKEHQQRVSMDKKLERKQQIARYRTKTSNAIVKAKVLTNANSKRLPNYGKLFSRLRRKKTE